MGDLRDRWLESYLLKERGLSPSTARTYHYGVRRIEEYAGKAVWELTTRDARLYLLESNDPPATKHICLAAFKSYHRFECLEFDRSPNGILALQGPRVPQKTKRELSGEEARAIIEACQSPRDYRLVFPGLFAGLRVCESARLKEWADGKLQVLGKGSKPREVPVHPELERVKWRILAEQVTVSQLRYRSTVLGRRTGIRFSSHDLRHTFGRRMRRLNVEHVVTKELLGHSTDITSVYSPVLWDEMVEAVHRNDYGERAE